MTIRLKLMKNTAQISFPSLWLIFSDKLLGGCPRTKNWLQIS